EDIPWVQTGLLLMYCQRLWPGIQFRSQWDSLPVPSTSLPPVQSQPPRTAPIPASTPTPIPETDSEPMEHTFEEPSPAHQHFSPPQEHA
ncbi:hypothetical protein Tco_1012105, partial [Tanacetum coccineum]